MRLNLLLLLVLLLFTNISCNLGTSPANCTDGIRHKIDQIEQFQLRDIHVTGDSIQLKLMDQFKFKQLWFTNELLYFIFHECKQEFIETKVISFELGFKNSETPDIVIFEGEEFASEIQSRYEGNEIYSLFAKKLFFSKDSRILATELPVLLSASKSGKWDINSQENIFEFFHSLGVSCSSGDGRVNWQSFEKFMEYSEMGLSGKEDSTAIFLRELEVEIKNQSLCRL